MDILIVGGTGMIGRRLVRQFLAAGHDVTVSSRSSAPKNLPTGVRTVQWDGKSTFPLERGVDVLVNVTGASLVGKRWTESYKKELRESRIGVNRRLAEWCRTVQPPPRVFVSSSAVGYYGVSPPGPVTEESPPGDDFLARLCLEWEDAAKEADTTTRVVTLRQGVVLDRESDALQQAMPFFRLGVGGKVGSGRQPFPWITSHDLVRLFQAVIEEDAYRGPVNAVVPGPDTNTDFTSALGRALKRPTIFPVPPFMLRALYGEPAQLMTHGQEVVPARAKALGFTWTHPAIEPAMRWAIEGSKDPAAAPPRMEAERPA